MYANGLAVCVHTARETEIAAISVAADAKIGKIAEYLLMSMRLATRENPDSGGRRWRKSSQGFELKTLPAHRNFGDGRDWTGDRTGHGAIGRRCGGADLAGQLAGIEDAAVAERAASIFRHEMRLWLGVEARVLSSETGVCLSAGEQRAEVDLLLAALGRRSNMPIRMA